MTSLMMKKILFIIQHTQSPVIKKMVIHVINRCCPSFFVKRFYQSNVQKVNSWNGFPSCLTLSFDCDRDVDYRALPELLIQLKSLKLVSSFACIGKWVEKIPDIHEQILLDGHEILNHTYTHPSNIHFHPGERFNQLTIEERIQEIVQADLVLQKILNFKAIGFRSPHFGDSHTKDIHTSLIQNGYRYSSSVIAIQTPSYGLPYRIQGNLWEFPLSIDPQNIMLTFDTYGNFRSSRSHHTEKTERQFFTRLKKIIDLGIQTNSYINLFFDPQDLHLLNQFKDFLVFLNSIKNKIWITSYCNLIDFLENSTKLGI